MEVRAMKRAGERSLGTGDVRRAMGRAERRSSQEKTWTTERSGRKLVARTQRLESKGYRESRSGILFL